jgi:hypothetical protein
MQGTGFINHLVLLPARDAYDMSLWGASAANFSRTFSGVVYGRDPYALDLAEFERVTVVNPDFWPGDVMAYLRQHAPRIQIEVLFAPTAAVLGQILAARAFYGQRVALPEEVASQQQQVATFADSWPRGVCLIGLHGRGDGELHEADFNVFAQGRIEACKLTSHATGFSVQRLLSINPRMYFMVRSIASFDNGGQPRRISANEFADATIGDLARTVDGQRVRDIEIHNEPNLVIEGLGGSWNNGREFGDWWLAVRDRYRQAFPSARFGFPGLSPGGDVPGVRYDSERFLNEAAFAVQEADWVGVHSYWVVARHMTDPNIGFQYLRYRARYPGKLLYITEFGAPLTSKTDQAQQYAQYYAMLRHEPGVGAAFSYIVSTSNSEQAPKWSWRAEDGKDLGIAPVIGARTYVG